MRMLKKRNILVTARERKILVITRMLKTKKHGSHDDVKKEKSLGSFAGVKNEKNLGSHDNVEYGDITEPLNRNNEKFTEIETIWNSADGFAQAFLEPLGARSEISPRRKKLPEHVQKHQGIDRGKFRCDLNAFINEVNFFPR